MGKDTKIDAGPVAGTGNAIANPAFAKGDSPGAEVKLIREEKVITDIKTTVIAVMDHVIALTVAVQAIAVGGRRPQNVRELVEAVTAARAYRKTL